MEFGNIVAGVFTPVLANYSKSFSLGLLCRGRVVGVINLQNRQHHVYRQREIRMISTIGFSVGAEIELARLEQANSTLAEQLHRGARQGYSPA